MSYYDRKLETLDPAALRALQEKKLRRLMSALPRSAFYRRKLAAAGIRAEDVGSLADLQRLPFTTKAEIVASQEAAPPYGELRTEPLSWYRYLHQTSGTTGRPLYWLDSDEDWQTWMRAWGHVYCGAGVHHSDVVLCAFSFGPFIAHWTALQGAREMGAMAIPSSGLSSRQRLDLIAKHNVTVLVSTPTYALHLAEVAAQNGIDAAELSVRITIHAGEPGASIPNVRERIEDAWGARTYDHAGATEVGAWGFDCQVAEDEIHLNELEFFFEFIDPETLEPVPDGELGELVITTLSRNGMPVVRYRTGDLVIHDVDPCPCGRHLTRLNGGVLGRADDMMIVRGVNVFPSAVDNVVRGFPEIAEYQGEVRGRGQLNELVLTVELAGEASLDDVAPRLTAAFQDRLRIAVVVEKADEELPRFELKARRFKREAQP